MANNIRRHDLDWLRVIVFGLLIFYHVGMFFVPWGFHLKNNVIYEWVRWPMLFVNQWRLSILFVISGMGTYYALSFRNGKQFSFERFKRLGLPLVFGMLLIIPPQVYFERLANNQFVGSYLDYFTTQAFTGVYPEGNLSWHHLWFLPYLLVFSVLLAPIFVYLKNKPTSRFIALVKKIVNKPFGLYFFIIPLYFTESLIEPFFPVTHALIGDWFALINYIILFFYGFILISVKDEFWTVLDKMKSRILIIALVSFGTLIFIWLSFQDSTIIHFTEAFFKVTNFWSWILVIFGYAAKYLNKPSKLLTYSNKAVYPFYILHQSVMIVLCYYVMNLSWGFTAKFLVLSGGTFFISWVIYDLVILRVSFLKPFFGLKK